MRKNSAWNEVRSPIPLSLLLLSLPLIAACNSKVSSPLNDYTAFSNPELVTITGYSGGAMEPFISRDGAYLFFNNTRNNKDLYYASRVASRTYRSATPISAINSSTVDGVPTVDDADKFYYVSLAHYNGTTNKDTLYVGTWNAGTVTDSTPLTGLTLDPPLLYFDIEVNPDGSTLYLSMGAFPDWVAFPATADIAIAIGSGSSFSLAPNWTSIMANVNTADKLEYAPAISRNGLELFFTRFDPNTREFHIYRSVRTDTKSAFGIPQSVIAIKGFVEGPAFSPDEKSLYYHRQSPVTKKFEIFRVIRP